MWDLILNPFITVLVFLYQLLGQNTVLAIVAFTILIRLLTHPLTVQQQRSMKAQQELQPKLKKLQEKYKNDREKLAQAQMDLYREYGINPAGGCLPLLIQFPILIGLYQAIIQVLGATPLQLLDLSGRILVPSLDSLIPLQNQFLWMNLAEPDPFYVLPILVLITTWVQQRLLTPQTSGDEGQAAAMTRSMTTVMPIMFFFFALSFASGLSIYFVVSNIIGIIQYSMMGRADLGNLLPFLRRDTESENAGKNSSKKPAK
ncbi:MAG: YidC/Oxa1 family membrane protein insertase [Anaerolineae bacterium]